MSYVGAKPLTVLAGGTGRATLTDHGILVGAGTAAITQLAVGSTGNMLRGNTGADPSFSSLCPGSFSFSISTAGSMVVVTSQNTNNTNTSSSGTFSANVGGASAGDPMLQHVVTGVTTWSQGTDNSVTSPEADPYVISSSTALGTNDVMRVQGTGLITYPTQSCFFAYLPTTDGNQTGNGATYTLGTVTAVSEIFDLHGDFNTNGTYTAPITSKVDLRSQVSIFDTTIAVTFNVNIVTSNRTYFNVFTRTASNGNQSMYVATIADMDAGDTAIVTAIVGGEAANTNDVAGSGSPLFTYFCGVIVA